MNEQMVSIAEFNNEFEAELACGHLKAAGIHTMILKDDAGGMFPSLQETEGVRVLVPQKEKEQARRTLDEKRK